MSIYWVYLILAGLFEIGFATSLGLSKGFTKIYPVISFVICAVLSFWLLTKAMESIPIGTAYAVWTGIGAVGTVLVGMIFLKESTDFWRIFFIVTLIGSIIGLKLSTGDAAN
jgi:quaternary ammonium compound-resistance protein SugE